MKKKDEMQISIQLQAYKWAIIVGWIVAVAFFVYGAIFGVLHFNLVFIPFVQTVIYGVVKLIKTEKMADGSDDEE